MIGGRTVKTAASLVPPLPLKTIQSTGRSTSQMCARPYFNQLGHHQCHPPGIQHGHPPGIQHGHPPGIQHGHPPGIQHGHPPGIQHGHPPGIQHGHPPGIQHGHPPGIQHGHPPGIHRRPNSQLLPNPSTVCPASKLIKSRGGEGRRPSKDRLQSCDQVEEEGKDEQDEEGGQNRSPVWERLYLDAGKRAKAKRDMEEKLTLENEALALPGQRVNLRDWDTKWRKMINHHTGRQKEKQRSREHFQHQRLLEEFKECTFHPRRFTADALKGPEAQHVLQALVELTQQQNVLKLIHSRCDEEEKLLDSYVKATLKNAPTRSIEETQAIADAIRDEVLSRHRELLEQRLDTLHQATELDTTHYQYMTLAGIDADSSEFDKHFVAMLRNTDWAQQERKGYPILKFDAAVASHLHQLRKATGQPYYQQEEPKQQRRLHSTLNGMGNTSEQKKLKTTGAMTSDWPSGLKNNKMFELQFNGSTTTTDSSPRYTKQEQEKSRNVFRPFSKRKAPSRSSQYNDNSNKAITSNETLASPFHLSLLPTQESLNSPLEIRKDQVRPMEHKWTNHQQAPGLTAGSGALPTGTVVFIPNANRESNKQQAVISNKASPPTLKYNAFDESVVSTLLRDRPEPTVSPGLKPRHRLVQNKDKGIAAFFQKWLSW